MTSDAVLIFLRGEDDLRDVAWTLLEAELIQSADSVVRYEAYLAGGNKRKMSSNKSGMMLVARRDLLDEVMARIRQLAEEGDVSAYAVPVLASVEQ